ncbi:MAG: Rrf2 family transcriptional regulator [Phycisphaerales bacterium]|nr:Rrf2 family transcriptional regulator [Phycisphaerales bacterium]
MFSQTAEYALRAMIHLASRAGAPTTSEVIAATTQVPAGYLSKILRGLVVARLIRSQRGPNGGFTLALPVTSVTVLDIVNAVDPIRRIDGCPLGGPHHPRLCALHSRLDNALERIESELRSATLAAIIDEQSAGGRCHGPAGAAASRPAEHVAEHLARPTINGVPPAA